jgi:hypothetical protein
MRPWAPVPAVLIVLIVLTACTGPADGTLGTSGSPPSATAAAVTTKRGTPTTSAAVAVAAPSSSDASTTIPQAFRGHWNTDLADCSQEFGEGRLIVQALSVTFYESTGKVVTVSERGGVLTVSMRLTGEGQSWQETRSIRLAAGGSELIDVETGTVRYRCP